LPSEIQVVGWAACPSLDFSARFNCVNRTYKYFFPRGDLSLELINEGGSYLVGEHDFRNFCKMDIGNGVVNYHRRITSVTASVIQTDQSDEIKRSQILVRVMYSWHGHIPETCINLMPK